MARPRRAGLRSMEGDRLVRNGVYDLRIDPGETRNLAGEKLAVGDGARRRLAELEREGAGRRRRARRRGRSPAGAGLRLGRAVHALGFRGQSGEAIAAWNTLERELARLTSGEARAALPGLARLARAFPDSRSSRRPTRARSRTRAAPSRPWKFTSVSSPAGRRTRRCTTTSPSPPRQRDAGRGGARRTGVPGAPAVQRCRVERARPAVDEQNKPAEAVPPSNAPCRTIRQMPPSGRIWVTRAATRAMPCARSRRTAARWNSTRVPPTPPTAWASSSFSNGVPPRPSAGSSRPSPAHLVLSRRG